MSNHYGNDYATGASSQYYGTPQSTSTYSTYEPPKDNGYRHDMAVSRYDDEQARYRDDRDYDRRDRYDDNRSYAGRRSEHDGGNYDRRRSPSRRSSWRGSRRGSTSRGVDGERGLFGGGDGKEHHKGKDIGATLIGGAVGAFAGHELGRNGIASGLGALAGVFAGHELEKRHEKKKDRRELEHEEKRYDSYSNGGRRSVGGSRYEDDEYSDDDYDDRQRTRRRSERYD